MTEIKIVLTMSQSSFLQIWTKMVANGWFLEQFESQLVNNNGCEAALFLQAVWPGEAAEACLFDNVKICKIWGFQGSDYEEYRLLGCYTM
jgi:hypothetical protein